MEEQKEEILETPIEVETENYLIGTYTDSLSQGINLISFNPEKEKLELIQVIDSLPKSFIYSCK
ncbi:MAG: lactonase family protein [Flavobacterium sp.]|nr:lactonase family protein [Flavobacterium sp.]